VTVFKTKQQGCL
jgi:ATP-dependent phosphoenolpyruvate carboxykinase